MKKTNLFIFFFLIIFSYLSPAFASVEVNADIDALQEFCAKETDPIKRLNYCSTLESQSKSSSGSLII